jgi:hypothetical protein
LDEPGIFMTWTMKATFIRKNDITWDETIFVIDHTQYMPHPHAFFYPLINGLYLVFKSSKFFLFVYKVQHLAVYTFKIRNMLQIPTPALSPLPLRHFSPLPSAPPHRLSLPSPPSGRKFGKSSTLIRKTLLPARHLSTQILEQQISLLFPSSSGRGLGDKSSSLLGPRVQHLQPQQGPGARSRAEFPVATAPVMLLPWTIFTLRSIDSGWVGNLGTRSMPLAALSLSSTRRLVLLAVTSPWQEMPSVKRLDASPGSRKMGDGRLEKIEERTVGKKVSHEKAKSF